MTDSLAPKAISPTYTGPTSPTVDRNLLYMLTRSGDGDPRSRSYYNEMYENVGDVDAAAQQSSLYGQTSPNLGAQARDSFVREVYFEDSMLKGPSETSLSASGLQSKGLQSNAHAFCEQGDQDSHAMQLVYTDLDAANSILERFCNKHLLGPSISVEASLRMKKISLKMEHYGPFSSRPVVFNSYTSPGMAWIS